MAQIRLSSQSAIRYSKCPAPIAETSRSPQYEVAKGKGDHLFTTSIRTFNILPHLLKSLSKFNDNKVSTCLHGTFSVMVNNWDTYSYFFVFIPKPSVTSSHKKASNRNMLKQSRLIICAMFLCNYVLQKQPSISRAPTRGNYTVKQVLMWPGVVYDPALCVRPFWLKFMISRWHE